MGSSLQYVIYTEKTGYLVSFQLAPPIYNSWNNIFKCSVCIYNHQLLLTGPLQTVVRKIDRLCKYKSISLCFCHLFYCSGIYVGLLIWQINKMQLLLFCHFCLLCHIYYCNKNIFPSWKNTVFLPIGAKWGIVVPFVRRRWHFWLLRQHCPTDWIHNLNKNSIPPAIFLLKVKVKVKVKD